MGTVRLLHGEYGLPAPKFGPSSPKSPTSFSSARLTWPLHRPREHTIRSKLEKSSCLANSPPDVLWDHTKTAILQASNETVELPTHKKEWIDYNIQDIQNMLAENDQHTNLTWLKLPAYRRRRPSVLHAALFNASFEIFRIDGGPTLLKKLSIATPLVNVGDSTRPRKPYMPKHMTLLIRQKAPYGLRSADGKELHAKNDPILNRWLETEHLKIEVQCLRIVELCFQQSAIDRIPRHSDSQQPVKTELNKTITPREMLKAAEQLKSGNRAGIDGIPQELER